MSAPVPAILTRDLEAIRRRLRRAGMIGFESKLFLACCADIDRSRRRGKRRYFAHVGHRIIYSRANPAEFVCVSPALARQRPAVRRGVLWHEVGHLLEPAVTDPRSSHPFGIGGFLRDAEAVYRTKAEAREQARANLAVWLVAGVRIRYDRRGVEVAR